MNLLENYEKWLKKEGVISANNYSTRFKRAIAAWNKYAVDTLKPFESKIIPLFSSKNADEYINNVVFRLLKYTEEAWKKDEFSTGYRNDIFTAINRFGEFVQTITAADIQKSIKTQSQVKTSEVDSPQKDERLFKEDASFFSEFDIDILLSAIVNRTRTRESAFWPARKFSKVLPEKGKWVTNFIDSLIIMTECGIHKISEVSSFKIQEDILYVKPVVYQNNTVWTHSKAKNLAHISSDGYVKAYSYHADGSIHPFRVKYDSSGSPIPSISFEHTPAISLLISTGNYPEIKNLIDDKMPDAGKLQKEMSDLICRMTCVLMERDENVLKKNAW